MAEGWTRRLKGALIEPYSAGTEAHGLDVMAVKVMAEAGVDISGYRSKQVEELRGVGFDYVVTVCDRANESCPVFPAGSSMSMLVSVILHPWPGAPGRKTRPSGTTEA
jgi:arsenate reductase